MSSRTLPSCDRSQTLACPPSHNHIRVSVLVLSKARNGLLASIFTESETWRRCRKPAESLQRGEPRWRHGQRCLRAEQPTAALLRSLNSAGRNFPAVKFWWRSEPERNSEDTGDAGRAQRSGVDEAPRRAAFIPRLCPRDIVQRRTPGRVRETEREVKRLKGKNRPRGEMVEIPG